MSAATRPLHLSPPFRAEHVGSLLRPPPLHEMRQRLSKNGCSLHELKAVESEAVKHVVNMELEVGVGTITDGEMGRDKFFDGVFESLEGMTWMKRPLSTFKKYIPHIAAVYGESGEAESIYCTGKIKRAKPFFVEEFKRLKSLVPPERVKHLKITICSPSWTHQRHGSDYTYDRLVYKTDDEYFDDIGAAYREEIKELYELGCRHIQIDDPTFCYLCSSKVISEMEAAGVDHEALFDTYIRAINVCTQGRPDDLTIGVHMCRGNYIGMHFSEGSYDRIAPKLFTSLDVDAFYLEYDTDRAGGFSALKHLPRNKAIVLGLVTTKSPVLEDAGQLKVRVHEAVAALMSGDIKRSREEALNQICISTQCGFASTWEGNPLTEEDEKNKLALLINAAKEIWGC